MIALPKVTMICIDTLNHWGAIHAMAFSLKQIQPAKSIFLSDIEIDNPLFESVVIEKIISKEAYSDFVVKELHKYFNTEFVLLIQHDGYVLDGSVWDDEFFNIDYIGATWIYSPGFNVGNGGFSLRSKKLMQALATDPIIEITHPEDEITGRLYKKHLEKTHGIKFASEELANVFSFELNEPKQSTFGFHGYFHPPYDKIVVIKRTAAMGDVVAVEPILEYFYSKGYKVYLDTFPQFYLLFSHSRYPVWHVFHLQPGMKHEYYDLDMSYEENPKQLHLKSYFEKCGVTDYKLRNPSLYLNIPENSNTKLFKKYCILHIDKRGQNGRNIQGDINWIEVVYHLNAKGYDVFQLGKGEHEEVKGAIQMNVPGETFLLWVVRDSDLFIGIDSGISNIALACNKKMIVFHGNVNPEFIYPDLTNVRVIQNHDTPVCDTPYCWHTVKGCEGIPCYVDESKPPCVQFKTSQVMKAINELA